MKTCCSDKANRLYESFQGMRFFRSVDGQDVYRCRCKVCNATFDVPRHRLGSSNKINLAELRTEARRVFGVFGTIVEVQGAYEYVRCTFYKGDLTAFGKKQRARRMLYGWLTKLPDNFHTPNS